MLRTLTNFRESREEPRMARMEGPRETEDSKGAQASGDRSCPQKKDAAFCNAEMSESGGF